MGHDHHFLSRLDRLDLSHAELALGLYRDHELVRRILDTSSAPPGARRIALSLDHPEEGPFVLVDRSGRFTTCLARGMRTDLPVVRRAELDSIRSHVGAFREAARALSHGDPRQLLWRLMGRAESLFVEDLPELRVVHPLVEAFQMRRVLQLSHRLVDGLPLARRLAKTKGARGGAAAAEYSRMLWRYQNHMIFAGMGSPHVRDLLCRHGLAVSLLRPAFSIGLNPPIVAAAWLTAQFGPDAIDSIREHARIDDPLGIFDAALGLCAIASKHPECRSDVRRILMTLHLPGLRDRHPAAEMGLAALKVDEQQALVPAVQRDAQRLVFEHLSDFYPDARRFEDVPADVAVTLRFHAPFHLAASKGNLLESFCNAMAVAKLGPEALCLPRAFATLQTLAFEPRGATLWLQGIRAPEALPKPRRGIPGPGRNAACSCGSGKKFKRCCAWGQSAPARAA
jgi:hypothetical protein